jgi:hypothetical protein
MTDGTVDLSAVLSSFEVVRTISTGPHSQHYSGRMLGDSFQASSSGDVLSGPFKLSIGSTGLSEHAVYMTAVLLTDIICLTHNRGVEDLAWAQTSVNVGAEWQVKSSCSLEPRMTTPSGD